TLTALAGDGALERVLYAALTEASLPVGAVVSVCFRVAEGGELLCIGGTTEPARIRAPAAAASGPAAAALAPRNTVAIRNPLGGPRDGGSGRGRDAGRDDARDDGGNGGGSGRDGGRGGNDAGDDGRDDAGDVGGDGRGRSPDLPVRGARARPPGRG